MPTPLCGKYGGWNPLTPLTLEREREREKKKLDVEAIMREKIDDFAIFSLK